MKFSIRYNNITVFVFFAMALIILNGCHSKNQSQSGSPAQNQKVLIDSIPISNVPIDMTRYDTTSDFKEYYEEPVAPPPFDYTVDLSKKTLVELRNLKNEIYARHGYLFNDAILRGYFNQFDWYQPIFWDTAFKVSLNKNELDFINMMNEKYDVLLKENYVTKDGKKFANMNNIVNLIQFDYVSDTLMQHLTRDGFAIAPATNMQLYDVYDQNQYKAIPSFVTTDSYLQLLYLHLRHILEGMEEEKFIPAMDTVIKGVYNQSMQQANDKNTAVKKAASFNAVYFAVSYFLLKGQTLPVPTDMEQIYRDELKNVKNEIGRASKLMGDSLFDYTQLKPRGHYTINDTMKGYFRCLKWLMTTPFYTDDEGKLSSMILTSINLNNLKSEGGRNLSDNYRSIDETIGFLVGSPDNLSLTDVTKILKDEGLWGKPESEIISSTNLVKIAAKLKALEPQQIRPKGTDDTTQRYMDRTAVYFMPGRYTMDAEILQRLIQVLKPAQPRLFPKGLDVFAALGNKTAENILLHTYKENSTWPGYSDTLKTLQSKFNNYNGYNTTYYNNMMGSLVALQSQNDSFPYYMHSDAWARKTLNTSLASWTELKHTVVLYAKQPNAAECGEGGGPPPPVYPGYVEPNVAFWKNCLSMLNLTSKKLKDNGVESKHLEEIDSKLVDMATFFLLVSQKEINGQDLNEKEFNQIMWIGGEMESLSQRIANSDMSLEANDDPEKCIGLATDVYTYNDKCLEEATGWGNEIYVVAEINGLLYLTRGAVLSYYEFQQPSSDRLTDEEWQEKMNKGNLPPIPVWMNDLMAPIKALETKSFYTYSANPSSLKGQ